MCPGGPELPLNTVCNVGSRLRVLLQEKPLAGENLAFGSQGSQNRKLQIPFGSLVRVVKGFVYLKSTWALLCLRGCTGWMLLTQGAYFQYFFFFFTKFQVFSVVLVYSAQTLSQP